MRHGEAIRLGALMAVAERRDLDVQATDPGYEQRFLRRWYSKRFFTPLAEVVEVPEHDILVAFWEEHYEDMDEADLEDVLEETMSTPAEVVRQRNTSKEDAEFLRRVAEEVAKTGGIMARREPDFVEPIKAPPPVAEPVEDEIPPERIEFDQGDPIDFTLPDNPI